MAPIVFLSGMGADARVFEKQLARFPGGVCPPWIEPVGEETIAEYAGRLARKLKLREPAFLVGASFGGFVAMEMARLVPTLAVVLIGSAKSPAELPPAIRAMGRAARLPAVLPFSLIRPLSRLILSAPDSSLRPGMKSLIRQGADADERFLRWGCGAVLHWRANEKPLAVPLYHIHGTADRILPIRYVRPTHVIRGGGHVLSMTHADRVTAIISEVTGSATRSR